MSFECNIQIEKWTKQAVGPLLSYVVNTRPFSVLTILDNASCSDVRYFQYFSDNANFGSIRYLGVIIERLSVGKENLRLCFATILL